MKRFTFAFVSLAFLQISACNSQESASSLAFLPDVAERVRQDCDDPSSPSVQGAMTLKIPGATVVTFTTDLCNNGSRTKGLSLADRDPFPNGLIVVANASDPKTSPEIPLSSKHYDDLRKDGYGVVHMDNVKSPEQAQERMTAWLKKSGYSNGYPGTAHVILHDHGAPDGKTGSNQVPGAKMATSIATGLNSPNCHLGVSTCYSGAVLDGLKKDKTLEKFDTAWSSSASNEKSNTFDGGFETGEAAGRQHAQFLSDVAQNRNLKKYDVNGDGTVLTSEVVGVMKTPGVTQWEATQIWNRQPTGWVATPVPDANSGENRQTIQVQQQKLPDGRYVDSAERLYPQTPQVGADGVMHIIPKTQTLATVPQQQQTQPQQQQTQPQQQQTQPQQTP
jgi:hypothetical protein